MIDFKKYADKAYSKEEVVISRCLMGAVVRKRKTVKVEVTYGVFNELSSLDVYLLNMKIWHQEKIINRENGATVAL